MLKYVYILIYLVSLLIAIVFFSKIKKTKSHYFVYLLTLGLITETAGYYIGFYTKLKYIYLVYNIYALLNFSFFILLYRSFIENVRKKKAILFILCSFLVVAIITYLLIDTSILKYQLTTFIYGSFCLIVTIFIYLSDLFDKDIILNIKSVFMFWVSIGCLLFYICYLPVFTLASYAKYNVAWHTIILFLNIIMHLCFITGFILSKKEYNN